MRLMDADKFKQYAGTNITATIDGEGLIEPDATVDNYLLSFPPIDPVHAAGGCYCRECVYSSKQGGFSNLEEAETCVNCRRLLTITHNILVMPEDGFCSHGKRREEGTDD